MPGIREWFAEIPSTQDRALSLARSGAEEGTRVVAGQQGKGRGRLDHGWESPVGGLYVSIVLASPEPHPGLLPIAIGTALAEEMGHRYELSLAVKWPNDVLVVDGQSPSRKLAGILIDRVNSPRRGERIVAGIGVNVAIDRAHLCAEIRHRVAVLSELFSPTPTVDEVEAVAVEAVLRTAAQIRSPAGCEALLDRCRQRLWGVGRHASVDGHPVGEIVALGDEGELLVEERGERMAIRTGDLRVDETA